MKKPDLKSVRITSDRLVMVPVSAQWREDIFREFTEEITVHMFPPAPKSIADTDAFIAKSIAEMDAGTDLVLVTLKDSEFVGCTGMHRIHTRAPEAGIWIKKSAHGGKYGREAVTAVKEWADRNLDFDYVEYPVVKENISSRKIAESLGGDLVHEFDKKNGRGEDRVMAMYHIPKRTIWFVRKTYGWGWTPVTWQGWALVAGYIAVLVSLAFATELISPEPEFTKEVAVGFILPAMLATAGIIRICFAFGESPKWQWGSKN